MVTDLDGVDLSTAGNICSVVRYRRTGAGAVSRRVPDKIEGILNFFLVGRAQRGKQKIRALEHFFFLFLTVGNR